MFQKVGQPFKTGRTMLIVASFPAVALAEPLRRARHRFDPSRVHRPHHRHRRTSSCACLAPIRDVLQRVAHSLESRRRFPVASPGRRRIGRCRRHPPPRRAPPPLRSRCVARQRRCPPHRFRSSTPSSIAYPDPAPLCYDDPSRRLGWLPIAASWVFGKDNQRRLVQLPLRSHSPKKQITSWLKPVRGFAATFRPASRNVV